jgi:hypothetical protein
VERLTDRIEQAGRALATLETLARIPAPSPVERDAAILRFVYAFDTVIKATRLFLKNREGLDAGSPKAVFRAGLTVGLVSIEEAETGLRMTDDRNLTVHTYNEALAVALFARIGDHAVLLRRLLGAVAGQEAAPEVKAKGS